MKRVKSTVYLNDEMNKKIDKHILSHDYKSKNDFYIRAIENQIATDMLGNGGDILTGKLAKAIEKNTQTLSARISKGMFRYAVDLSMIMHMHAAILELEDDTISGLRGRCIQDVKQMNGKISLESIADFQNSDKRFNRMEDEWDD